MKDQKDIIIDALTSKIRELEKELQQERHELTFHFEYIQSQSEDVKLDFAKHCYNFCFDADMWGDDKKVFDYAVGALTPILQCTNDKDLFLKINDYVYRLEDIRNQLKDVGSIYNTDVLFGHEDVSEFTTKDEED